MYKLCNYSYISYLHNFFTIHFWLSLRFCQIANGCGQLWVTSVNQMYGAMFWFWSSEVQQRPKPLDMSSASFGILRIPRCSKVFQSTSRGSHGFTLKKKKVATQTVLKQDLSHDFHHKLKRKHLVHVCRYPFESWPASRNLGELPTSRNFQVAQLGRLKLHFRKGKY